MMLTITKYAQIIGLILRYFKNENGKRKLNTINCFALRHIAYYKKKQSNSKDFNKI